MAKKNRIRKKRNESVVLRSFAGSIEEAFSEDISEISEEDVIVMEAPPKSEKKKTVNRFYFAVGLLVIVFAAVGIVNTVVAAAGLMSDMFGNTALKNEFQLYLYPVVATDIPTFESAEAIANTTVIKAAVSKIMLTGDTSKYQSETGVLYIPEFDVETNAKSLFGSSLTLEHRTVGFGEELASYDKEKKAYAVIDAERLPNYYPEIVSVSNIGETYTVTVDYYPPSVSIPGIDKISSKTKSMVYTIMKSGDKKTITAVSRSDSMQGGAEYDESSKS